MAAGRSSIRKGMRSLIDIYNMDLCNPASRKAIMNAVTMMDEEVEYLKTEMNDVNVRGSIQDNPTLVLYHRLFTDGTNTIKEQMSLLGNVVRLASSLKEMTKETIDCMHSILGNVKRQFNIGFDQAKDGYSALRRRVKATPRLRESPIIMRIMDEIGDNIELAQKQDNDDVQASLNHLDNVQEGHEALNNAVDEIYNDFDEDDDEKENIKQVQDEITTNNGMWKIVKYLGIGLVLILGVLKVLTKL